MNSVIGPEGSRPVLRRFLGGRNRIFLTLFFVAFLLATVSFTVNNLLSVRAQSVDGTLATPAQLDQLKLQLNSKIHIVTPKPHIRLASAVLPYNNVGTSNDTATAQGNFDGAGNSYSAQALVLAGVIPNQTFMYDGITFLWPGAAAGSANNYVAAGQVLPVSPVANATTLGFIGSAANGSSVGNATITYTDGTTQTFALGMSDWAQGQPSFGNTIVTATTYVNAKNGRLNGNRFFFYASVAVDSTKVVQSVTLPGSVSKGQQHIFTLGTRAAYTNSYNNVGMSNDANPGAGNFDGQGNSYSYQSFVGGPTNDLPPGSIVQYQGVDFPWPATLGGSPNNYQAQGQTVAVSGVSNAVRVAFAGAASNGPSCGTATLHFADGTSQPFQLCLSDWTLNARKTPASYGNIPFNIDSYRNTHSGAQSVYTFAFYTEVRVNPSSAALISVTLPSSTTGGQMHIFSIGTSAIEDFNNVGARYDAGTSLFANLDGAHNSYSIDAMRSAGMSAPDANDLMHFTYKNSVNFGVADSFSLFPDNLLPNQQTFLPPSAASASRLALLGASTNGAQVMTVSITYTNGTVQTAQVGFNDWAVPSPLRYNNTVAVTMPYFNGLQGKVTRKSYLYYTQVTLQAANTIKSIAFSTNANMHIYGISVG